MHAHKHTHTQRGDLRSQNFFPFMKGEGAKKYHRKFSFLDKLFMQLHKT